jgi:hypothetical protein
MTDTTTDESVEVVSDKIDLTELSRSITGFDQVAVRTRFHDRLENLMDDGLMFMRVMYFVHLRRNGAKDADAFNQCMAVPLSELTDLFDTGADGEEEDSESDAVQDRDREYAEFIIGTGLKYTMDEYLALTVQQRAYIIDAANKSR